MNHMTEEELIAYRDGETRDREIFAAHLNECAECRRHLDSIDAVFAALDAMPVPDPGEDYGRRVWERIAPQLPEKRAAWWRWSFELRRVLAFATVAALLLLAFFAGRTSRKTPPVAGVADSGKVRERVLLVAVGNHLGRSEMVLVELANAEPEKGQNMVNISAEQKRAEDLVAENRLYRQTALQQGDTVMASTLDDLERTLLDIANGPDEITPAQFQALQQRIAAKGILLKVRVVNQELSRRQGSAAGNPAKDDAPKTSRDQT